MQKEGVRLYLENEKILNAMNEGVKMDTALTILEEKAAAFRQAMDITKEEIAIAEKRIKTASASFVAYQIILNDIEAAIKMLKGIK